MQQGRRPSSAGSQKQQSAGTMNYSRVAAAASSSSSSPAARPADENSGTSSVAAETLLQEGFEQIVRRMQHLSHLPAKERPQIHSASASSNSPAARSPQKPKSVVSTGWGKPGSIPF